MADLEAVENMLNEIFFRCWIWYSRWTKLTAIEICRMKYSGGVGFGIRVGGILNVLEAWLIVCK